MQRCTFKSYPLHLSISFLGDLLNARCVVYFWWRISFEPRHMHTGRSILSAVLGIRNSVMFCAAFFDPSHAVEAPFSLQASSVDKQCQVSEFEPEDSEAQTSFLVDSVVQRRTFVLWKKHTLWILCDHWCCLVFFFSASFSVSLSETLSWSSPEQNFDKNKTNQTCGKWHWNCNVIGEGYLIEEF